MGMIQKRCKYHGEQRLQNAVNQNADTEKDTKGGGGIK